MAKNGILQEKIRSFYFAVGFAITQWQQVELALTQLFTLLLKSDARATSAAFNSVLSFRTKLAMVRSAAAVQLKDNPLLDECISLCNRLEKKAQKRNQLAHFMVIQEPVEYGHPAPEMDIDWSLRPTFFDGARERRYKRGAPRLTTNDVMNRANAFIT